LATGVIVLAAAVLGSHVTSDFAIRSAFLLVSWATFSGLLAWTLYTAVEPYVRRRWPQMLVAWSRLLDGRWRDPLVGRDLLVGSALAATFGVLQLAAMVALEPPHRLGLVPPAFNNWSAARVAVADLLLDLPVVTWAGLGLIVLLVVLRLVLRSARAAALVVIGIGALSGLGTSNPVLNVPMAAATAAVYVAIATRWGLLTFATFLFVWTIAFHTDGFETPRFAAGTVVLALAAQLAPGLFGFYTATRGRRFSAWLDG
jgi:serine/threonine-protein kinase